MLKPIITGIVFGILAICSIPLNAQEKYEKESRLKAKDVPSEALGFISSLEVPGKMRWYFEEGIERNSVEAKFKYNNEKYSIEFDTLGNLEDIEIKMKWKHLQKTLKDSITAQLLEDCKKFKIQKVQIQYSGDRSILLSKIKTGESTGNYIVRYEIVVKCSKARDVALFEYLFSHTGQQLSVSKIIFKNSSNLEY